MTDTPRPSDTMPPDMNRLPPFAMVPAYIVAAMWADRVPRTAFAVFMVIAALTIIVVQRHRRSQHPREPRANPELHR